MSGSACAVKWAGVGLRRWRCSASVSPPFDHPAAVGPIKEVIRKVDLGELSEQMGRWLASPPPSLRAELQAWATERGIEFD